MTGNKCDRMNVQVRVRGSCNRIGKTCSTTVKICEEIGVIYELIARIGVGIVTISEWINKIDTTIGKT
jgi:hypothetical protein